MGDTITPAFTNSIFNNIPVAIYICDTNGYITYFNTAAEDLWCNKPVLGRDKWMGAFKIYKLNGTPIPARDTLVAKLLNNEEVGADDNLLIERHDGSKVMVREHPEIIFDQTGKPCGAMNTLRDLTQINEVEKQARLAAIVSTSDDTIVSKTLAGIITSWNKAAEKMFGYSEAEALGKHISLVIPPERIKEEEYIIGEITKGNRVDHFETIRVAKNGTRIPISLSVSPIRDNNGKVIGASKIARDISEQIAAKDVTVRYTERLETINVMTGIISEELDLNKILQKVTDVTTRLTGAMFGAFFYNVAENGNELYSLYCISGAPEGAFNKFEMPRDASLLYPAVPATGVLRSDDITQDERFGEDFPHQGMPDGKLDVKSYLAVSVISRSGEVFGVLIFGHPDTGAFTEEHESIIVSIAAQAAIGIDNAKLYEEVKALNEKKDEFIGLASHELKTPLTSISGYLQILSRLDNNEKSRHFIDKTIQQVKKLTSLVSDLLDVSKIEAGKLELSIEKFDISTVVSDTVELMQLSNNNYKIVFKNDVDHLMVKGDPHRIEQVIINLLTNAIKYSPGADTVYITLSKENEKVIIAIKDQGIGIAGDKLTQIFSRFYRIEGTNPNISGLGIGLYISHEIMNRHNGQLWVDSEPGEGSTFYMSLPL